RPNRTSPGIRTMRDDSLRANPAVRPDHGRPLRAGMPVLQGRERHSADPSGRAGRHPHGPTEAARVPLLPEQGDRRRRRRGLSADRHRAAQGATKPQKKKLEPYATSRFILGIPGMCRRQGKERNMPHEWKTGELAKLTGLTIRTLRYYDQIGLFSPSGRTEAG